MYAHLTGSGLAAKVRVAAQLIGQIAWGCKLMTNGEAPVFGLNKTEFSWGFSLKESASDKCVGYITPPAQSISAYCVAFIKHNALRLSMTFWFLFLHESW